MMKKVFTKLWLLVAIMLFTGSLWAQAEFLSFIPDIGAADVSTETTELVIMLDRVCSVAKTGTAAIALVAEGNPEPIKIWDISSEEVFTTDGLTFTLALGNVVLESNVSYFVTIQAGFFQDIDFLENADFYDWTFFTGGGMGEGPAFVSFVPDLGAADVSTETTELVVMLNRECSVAETGMAAIALVAEGNTEPIKLWDISSEEVSSTDGLTFTLALGNVVLESNVSYFVTIQTGFFQDIDFLGNADFFDWTFSTGGGSTEPMLVLNKEFFEFQTTVTNQFRVDALTIENISEQSVELSFPAAPEGYLLEVTFDGTPKTITIEAGQTYTTKVAFAPKSGGFFERSFTVVTNDPAMPEIVIGLYGEGINPYENTTVDFVKELIEGIPAGCEYSFDNWTTFNVADGNAIATTLPYSFGVRSEFTFNAIQDLAFGAVRPVVNVILDDDKSAKAKFLLKGQYENIPITTEMEFEYSSDKATWTDILTETTIDASGDATVYVRQKASQEMYRYASEITADLDQTAPSIPDAPEALPMIAGSMSINSFTASARVPKGTTYTEGTKLLLYVSTKNGDEFDNGILSAYNGVELTATGKENIFSLNVQNLSAATSYYYKVKAQIGETMSPYSNIVAAHTDYYISTFAKKIGRVGSMVTKDGFLYYSTYMEVVKMEIANPSNKQVILSFSFDTEATLFIYENYLFLRTYEGISKLDLNASNATFQTVLTLLNISASLDPETGDLFITDFESRLTKYKNTSGGYEKALEFGPVKVLNSGSRTIFVFDNEVYCGGERFDRMTGELIGTSPYKSNVNFVIFNNTVYFIDTFNNKIYDKAGNVLAGNGQDNNRNSEDNVASKSGLEVPISMVADANGDLYIVTYDAIRKLSSTPPAAPIPAQPVFLQPTAEDVKSGEATIKWKAVADATGYVVKVYSNVGLTTQVGSDYNATATELKIESLSENTAYYCVAFAKNANGTSDASLPLTFKTKKSATNPTLSFTVKFDAINGFLIITIINEFAPGYKVQLLGDNQSVLKELSLDSKTLTIPTNELASYLSESPFTFKFIDANGNVISTSNSFYVSDIILTRKTVNFSVDLLNASLNKKGISDLSGAVASSIGNHFMVQFDNSLFTGTVIDGMFEVTKVYSALGFETPEDMTSGTDALTKRFMASFTVGENYYIATGDDGSKKYNDLWKISSTSEAAYRMADYPGVKRSEATAFAIGDYGYVGLGIDEGGNYLNDFFRYDTYTDSWFKIAAFPGQARKGAVSYVREGKAFVATGDNGSTYFNDVYQYDPATNSWTKQADFTGSARTNAAVFTLEDKVMIATGFDGTNYLNDIYSYEFEKGVWAKLESTVGDAGRSGAFYVVIDEIAYISWGKNPAEAIDLEAVYAIVTYPELSSNTSVHKVNPTLISSIRTYPNPTTGNISVELDTEESGKVSVEVYNMSGQKTQTTQFTKATGLHTENISLESPAKGIYFIKINTPSGNAVKRIVVE